MPHFCCIHGRRRLEVGWGRHDPVYESSVASYLPPLISNDRESPAGKNEKEPCVACSFSYYVESSQQMKQAKP